MAHTTGVGVVEDAQERPRGEQRLAERECTGAEAVSPRALALLTSEFRFSRGASAPRSHTVQLLVLAARVRVLLWLTCLLHVLGQSLHSIKLHTHECASWCKTFREKASAQNVRGPVYIHVFASERVCRLAAQKR